MYSKIFVNIFLLNALYHLSYAFTINNLLNKVKTGLGLSRNISQVCYEDLGCFDNDKPWYSLKRPLPLPSSPDEINTEIELFTKNDGYLTREKVTFRKVFEKMNYFKRDSFHNVFITHGFSSEGNSSWVVRLAKAYLKNRNANVFTVNWEKGSKKVSYFQAAANTRVVGAEISRFILHLIKTYGIDRSTIHLIGHSLGSHISAYVAKNVTSIGQLTALDPAQPAFEGMDKAVRLAEGDADFVDVIHTNTRPTIPFLGFGFRTPVGNSDYFVNGGLVQPGCKSPSLSDLNITLGFKEFLSTPIELLEKWIGCSHGRSYRYYIEALENDYCKFWGRKAGRLTKSLQKYTLGLSEDIIQKFIKCTPNTCSPIGLESKSNPLRGVFLISTRDSSPFCNNDFYTQQTLEFPEST